MEIVDLYIKAVEEMDRFMEGTSPDDLDKQSVDSAWKVRDLINHILMETLWNPEVLAKKTIAEVGDKYDGDLLGDDFKKVWADAKEKAVDAFKKEGALEGDVHVSWGDFPAQEYVKQMTFDVIVHGWDLAKSTGQDDTLDSELVSWVWEYAQPQEKMMREHKVIADAVEVPEDADLQTKMLGFLGRKR